MPPPPAGARGANLVLARDARGGGGLLTWNDRSSALLLGTAAPPRESESAPAAFVTAREMPRPAAEAAAITVALVLVEPSRSAARVSYENVRNLIVASARASSVVGMTMRSRGEHDSAVQPHPGALQHE